MRRRPGSPPVIVTRRKSLLRDWAPYIGLFAVLTIVLEFHKFESAFASAGALGVLKEAAFAMWIPELALAFCLVAKLLGKNLSVTYTRPMTPGEVAQLSQPQG